MIGAILVDKISVNWVRTKETSTLEADILPQNSPEIEILKWKHLKKTILLIMKRSVAVLKSMNMNNTVF